MRRIELARRDLHGLLARAPGARRWRQDIWDAMLVDPVEQLKELADLRARGLLSAEQFEHQKTQVLDGR
jgi:hypothetical protein